MSAVEVNFDGLVGPTHSFAGLAHGNVASAANEGQTSNPRAAALQGIAKMRALLALGLKQGVLPPHDRPHVPSLRLMGFTGSDAEVIAGAARASPELLANAASASAMWTANAATISPSADTGDGRLHITPANLASHFHRGIETATTTRVLRRIFRDGERFTVHDPIPFPTFGDEGAANHCRLTAEHGRRGFGLFVYGRSAFARSTDGAFMPRQAMEACHIVASTHGLWAGGGAVLAQQGEAAIRAGAFHNDVVCVSNETVLLFHAQAFEDKTKVLDGVRRMADRCGFEPVLIEIGADQLSLKDAITSYLFNSQIVTLPDGAMVLVAPAEVEEIAPARAVVDQLVSGNTPIRETLTFDLRQSMRNGGGPACLRLRVVLTEAELAAIGGCALVDVARLDALEQIVRRYYRDRLAPSDLADPSLLDEGRAALDEISRVLDLGSVHEFQRV